MGKSRLGRRQHEVLVLTVLHGRDGDMTDVWK